MYDYHTHNNRCGHAIGIMREYVESAVAKGVKEIGLSDHCPIYHLGNDPHVAPDTAMAWDEFPRYFSEMTELRDAYQKVIKVRLGVESDYVLGWDEHFRSLWEQYDSDYIIGSVHWLDGWNIFDKELAEGHTMETVFEAYLESIAAAAQSGIFDIIGHFDAIKTNGYMPGKGFETKVRAVIETIADANIAMELNTSGWRKRCREQYPSRRILTEAHRCGVPIVLGSDAHEPSLVAADFDRALALLRDIGFEYIATFERRERILIPISRQTCHSQ